MKASAVVGGEIGDGPWGVFVCGVTPGMFILGLGLDMPKPGPIFSDQCRMLASLFMATENNGELVASMRR